MDDRPRPVTPTGPRARPGNGLRAMAVDQSFLAENTKINNVERQRRLNQAAALRKAANDMNAVAAAHATASAASSAASLSDYENKLRAKVTAHGARTGMSKLPESELKQYEKSLASLVKSPSPNVNIKRIGDVIRKELKAEKRMGGSKSRRNRRMQRRSTRRN